MALTDQQKETLILSQIEKMKDSLVWSDIAIMFNAIQEQDRPQFIAALVNSKDVLIRRALSEYLRPVAALKVNEVLAKDPEFSEMVGMVMK